MASQSEKKQKMAETPLPILAAQESVGASYDIVNEPLPNPGSQIASAIAALKSSDWQKQFEACNTIRRAAVFHRQNFQQNPQVFKELVQPVNSLRSQVSKNACLAMSALFGELPSNMTD